MLYIIFAAKKKRLSFKADEPLKGNGLLLARQTEKSRETKGRYSIVGVENGGAASCGKEREWPVGAEDNTWLTASKEMGTLVLQPQGMKS